MEFCKQSSSKDGLSYACKECKSISDKKWREKNFDKKKEASARYYKENKEKVDARANKYRKENPEKVKESKAKHYQKNVVKVSKANKKWSKENPEKRKAIHYKWRKQNAENLCIREAEYRQKNPHKVKAAGSKYRKNNADKCRGWQANRRAAKLQRTPSWVDFEAIKAVYAEAKRLEDLDGIPRHVDHHFPLQGKLVSGFHIAANLKILTAEENLSKSNKFVPH